jgi:triphosphoribosyl-dephospho-CoA synthetase
MTRKTPVSVIALIALLTLLALAGCSNESGTSPADITAAFRAAGLEAENERPLTAADMGAAPMMHKDGLYIYLPGLGENKGGRVMVFDNEGDRDVTAVYYEELCRASALFCSHVIKQGVYLVQLNGDLPDETADLYRQALAEIAR